ncbi:queuosine salvage protein-like [Argiope bruennichi]|uniref:Queuosine 5'-phosphate N-glycosylase/hydrolase n=1 Tax=Argiope bruennichi TaxID=94029 RepID=A0A8T0ELZ7_ARGBR|nr:queuosine salvage protein-like [Argiope bruennichi]KAF8776882.1 Queuosine salvage protein like [Argiope bruennichi]
MVLSPRESGEFISSHAKHVILPPEGIEKAAEVVLKCLQEKQFTITGWWKSHELNPQSSSPFALDWVFLADTLNFSFWAEKGKAYKITFNGKTYTGYWSLCAAMNRAMQEGYDITSPAYYASISLNELSHIFRSDTGVEVPLLKERHKILQETGKCLVEKFNGTFSTCVAMANNNAQNLLKIVLDNFPSYRDVATFDGQNVTFYKRAQILIADIWLCFEGKGYGAFNDIDSLTIFADYRVPQALVYLGAMKYSDELLTKLKSDELLENGDRYEVEIRGCSIQACELICANIKGKKSAGTVPKDLYINSILIDNFLWEYRRSHATEMEHIPFHKTRCIYY